ncbi:hypothetical protein GXB85_05080 [Cellulomonas sp. APG4]|uniref:CueP family metal-binding protein n=1 Tax=Cellulomonas sp. APG4 TaxID=1538656 RepID=UPI00137A8BAB|nr:CueP family metal-binding protein [Cellulomonas sp. APG4]NCT90326.1 hypothetical protein [Cellulomonas sp. APG4]
MTAATSSSSRPRVLSRLAAAGASLLLLAACSTSSPEDSLQAELGLDGIDGREIVEQLDASTDDRPFAFMASVREDEVLLGDGTQEVAVALPEDELYVSIAPYVDQTHECYYHSLATCQGELVEQPVSVTITADDGTVLVDEDATTYANGFVGFWLPRDVEGTIEVTYADKTGSVPFSTGEGDPTCITTLQVA